MEKFNQLSEDKQQSILNAALQEFASKPYADASTNAITQAAGISKGALFHYFGNKKKLYLYLMQHTNDQIQDKVISDIPETGDLIELFEYFSKKKAKLAEQYPLMFEFLYQVFQEQPDEESYQALLKQAMQIMQELMSERIDTSKFRPGIDLQQAIEICTWVTEGFGKKYAQTHEGFEPEDMMKQSGELFQLLRTMIYED